MAWQAFYQTDSRVCLPRRVSRCWSFHYTDIHPSESNTQAHTRLTMCVSARGHQCLRCCHAAKQCASSPVCFSPDANADVRNKCGAWSRQPEHCTPKLTWGDVWRSRVSHVSDYASASGKWRPIYGNIWNVTGREQRGQEGQLWAWRNGRQRKRKERRCGEHLREKCEC